MQGGNKIRTQSRGGLSVVIAQGSVGNWGLLNPHLLGQGLELDAVLGGPGVTGPFGFDAPVFDTNYADTVEAAVQSGGVRRRVRPTL